MMPPRIKIRSWFFLLIGLASLLFWITLWTPAAAQQSNEATPTETVVPSSGPYITVTYIDGSNVRAGPSSFDYPIIGKIPFGGTAPALGRSPKGEWIQIAFTGGPKDTGWVYVGYISLSIGGMLPVVEPPPTPVPSFIPTVNPTFVAQLQAVPTSTRKPTFTPPPPLAIPTYVNSSGTTGGGQIGWVIAAFGLIGIIGMGISAFRRR